MIGEDTLRASVDYYIEHRPGSELARLVLWRLRPWSAMSRCWEVFKGLDEIEARRTAVELLRVVADRRALPWISEFLEDTDALIQTWGVGVLDQLLWSELIGQEEAEAVLRTEQHSNESVRERAEFIRSYLLSRAEAKRVCETGGRSGDESPEMA